MTSDQSAALNFYTRAVCMAERKTKPWIWVMPAATNSYATASHMIAGIMDKPAEVPVSVMVVLFSGSRYRQVRNKSSRTTVVICWPSLWRYPAKSLRFRPLTRNKRCLLWLVREYRSDKTRIKWSLADEITIEAQQNLLGALTSSTSLYSHEDNGHLVIAEGFVPAGAQNIRSE